MAQVTINSTRANRIISNLATTAFPSDLSVGESNGAAQIQRGLVYLPFTNIPVGATITSAILQLNNTDNTLATNTRTLQAYRMKQAWTVDCTWNTYNGTNNWGDAGAANTVNDREATGIGSVSVANNQAIDWFNLVLTASKVQEMFDGVITNNGLLLQMDTEDADLHAFSTFCRWVITYTTKSTFAGFLEV